MRLSFRHRIFLILIALGTVPAGLALVLLAVQLRSHGSPAGARPALEAVASSGRAALAAMDTTQLADSTRAALRSHAATLSRSLTLARRADELARYTAGAVAAAVLAVGALLLAASIRLAGHLSRQLSRPIVELVTWTRLIERREALPPASARGAPEFAALQDALRSMAAALGEARRRDLETERLRAFREIARRVAHEIRGPITSVRLAVAALERRRATEPALETPLSVLADETSRLEQLAREFAELGRLPEGPPAPIDVTELLEHVARAGVADGVTLRLESELGLTIHGHYEPLRRAVLNLIRNAAEAIGTGEITLRASRAVSGAVADGAVELAVVDHGPGVLPELQDRLFEPYVTTKAQGTGLGLALVRQTAEAHGGGVRFEETPGGGATFVVTLPAGAGT